MDIWSKVQMMLFVVCIVSLVFVIVRSRNNEMADIDGINLHILKRTSPRPIPEEQLRKVKKDRWIWAMIAFGIWIFLTTRIENWLYYSVLLKMGDSMPWWIMLLIRFGLPGLGILLIAIGIWWDVVRTRKPDNKYSVAAYVQSTFTNPKHRTRSAQLIYYDYKGLKCKLKTASITRYERTVGKLQKGDFVYIIVEERPNRVCFVGLSEERVEKEALY